MPLHLQKETEYENTKPDNFTANQNSATPLKRKPKKTLKRTLKRTPKRNREYDGFVPHCFDSDDNFILDVLLPQMEETWGFKLYLHSRDFTPGRDIKDNIEEAIEDSNSAIIIMSQGFVNSMWCKEEFTQCYLENMKDPAFNLFVIMRRPLETLKGISYYMKTFFERKTYLEGDDPDVYEKLAERLEDARQPDERSHKTGEHEPMSFRPRTAKNTCVIT